jgi:preprotein translocase subunit YajC
MIYVADRRRGSVSGQFFAEAVRESLRPSAVQQNSMMRGVRQVRRAAHWKERVSMSFFALALPALPPGISSFLPFVLIIVVFYFLLIRPNQNKQKVWQEMLNNLKPGDKITTTGGLRGTIFALRDDVIQLRLPPDNIKVEVVKSAIAAVTTPEEDK